MLKLMNDLRNGKIYNCESVLFERRKEYLNIRRMTSYSPHHKSTLFLDALRIQVLVDEWKTFVPASKAELYNPAMYYWMRLDTLPMAITWTLWKKDR